MSLHETTMYVLEIDCPEDSAVHRHTLHHTLENAIATAMAETEYPVPADPDEWEKKHGNSYYPLRWTYENSFSSDGSEYVRRYRVLKLTADDGVADIESQLNNIDHDLKEVSDHLRDRYDGQWMLAMWLRSVARMVTEARNKFVEQ